MKNLLLTALLLVLSTSSKATVSEFNHFFIPYERIQSNYICLNKQIMKAEFGIPLASMFEGIFSQTQTLNQVLSGNSTRFNINLLVSGSTSVTYNLNFDRQTSGGVTDYSFTLNMAAFNTLNGNSSAGQLKTIKTAKLSVISIIKTAELLHGTGNFRVWIKFNNLPPLAAANGVNAGATDWPAWPFTSSSPVYQAYKSQLISPSC